VQSTFLRAASAIDPATLGTIRRHGVERNGFDLAAGPRRRPLEHDDELARSSLNVEGI
jgi:hypothetical protein